jgi:hypothetical protein
MCLQSHQVQAIKKNIGSYEQYDRVLVLVTGVRLLAIQLVNNVTDDKTIWIPTQDQIQRLLLIQDYNLFQLIESFDDWCMDTFREDFNRTDVNFESLWFMFYMEKKHQMFWCWPCNNWKLLKYKQISAK